ncbi:preprotein translocase subunit SecB [Methylophaga lonarensis MPL]|uniref:Protein-export protein SecB n=1 Tax=Methylophaga lonarensis MPL TaxID=1286106 RepID=M7NUV6_9GAMM|nr:protein-export chaperone SecB [Methylophaga lonarensis]EMR12563.1 preprotein translocase subunit SecB [Methylophaga lonarensis MPL]
MAEENTAANQEQQPKFLIQKIYTKDISFEAPNSPEVFREEWNPQLDLQLGNDYQRIDEDNHEIVLSVTVTARVGDKVAFLAEVKQAGIFTLTGYTKEEMGPLVGSYCPTTLFPFVREVVSDVVTKGGFPALVLAPVNFDALYMHQIERAREQQAAAEQQAGQDQTH